MSYYYCERGDHRFRCWWPIVPSLMLRLGVRCVAQGLLSKTHGFAVDWDSVHDKNYCWSLYRMPMSLWCCWESYCIFIVYYGEVGETWIRVLWCIVNYVWTILYLIYSDCLCIDNYLNVLLTPFCLNVSFTWALCRYSGVDLPEVSGSWLLEYFLSLSFWLVVSYSDYVTSDWVHLFYLLCCLCWS